MTAPVRVSVCRCCEHLFEHTAGNTKSVTPARCFACRMAGCRKGAPRH